MASVYILSLLLILSLLRLSSSLLSETVLDAAEILTDSGFTSMAMTLELASQSLISHTSSLTIFAPADFAFTRSGQPSLALLQYHLLPLAFSFRSLKPLPYGAKIATVLPNHSLTVTTATPNGNISLNNVTVQGSPIFDDGSLIIFGIEKFFDPSFENSAITRRLPNDECVTTKQNLTGGFDNACAGMRSSGCSVMASFLEVQFLGAQERPALTIFAPSDITLTNRIKNVSGWASIFHRHVVPCKLPWNDLVDFEDGTELFTYLDGFKIKISRSGGIFMVNDLPIIFPDMYFSDWIVVHGIPDILEVPDGESDEVVRSASTTSDGSDEPAVTSLDVDPDQEENSIEHYHFSVYRS